MLTVHHLGNSQSERIVWLCEELGLPYELVRYDRDATGVAPAAYKALHPLGTAPIVTDGKLALAETGAIVDYILAKNGAGGLALTPDDSEFANYLFWLHYANGSMVPAIMVVLMFSYSGLTEPNDVAKSMMSRLDKAYELSEKRLSTVPYFGGSRFTMADIMMGYPLTRSRTFLPRDLSPYPGIRAFLKRIGDRQAFKRAMAKGDPDMPPLLA
jgi:glutathione S-transferase